jgi:hypothetical protein
MENIVLGQTPTTILRNRVKAFDPGLYDYRWLGSTYNNFAQGASTSQWVTYSTWNEDPAASASWTDNYDDVTGTEYRRLSTQGFRSKPELDSLRGDARK